MPQLRKLLSPSGIALVLICLFLPFVGVSCGMVEIEVSGWDMVVGGEPTVSGPGTFDGVLPNREASDEADSDDVPVQSLMVVFVLVLALALVVNARVRTAATRAATGLAILGFGALILVVNEFVVMSDIVDEIADSSSARARQEAADIVGTRFGFWLTLLVLIACCAVHATDLRDSRRRSQPSGSLPPPPPGFYPLPPPHQSGFYPPAPPHPADPQPPDHM